MNGTPWHACSPFSLSFIFLLGFFWLRWLFAKGFRSDFGTKSSTFGYRNGQATVMWTSHIISCQHLVRSNCHRDIVTTLNCHLWELYGLCFRQCLKARAEPKYEIAQTLVFSNFNLPIMISICREKGTCSYVMTWGVAYQLWWISRDYFSCQHGQYLILISWQSAEGT